MIMQSKFDSAAHLATQIGNEVAGARGQLGLRQDELALIAGVSARVVHQIEKGKATSRLDSVAPVLEALGLKLNIVRPGSSPATGAER